MTIIGFPILLLFALVLLTLFYQYQPENQENLKDNYTFFIFF